MYRLTSNVILLKCKLLIFEDMAKHVKMSRSDAPRRSELGLFMECEEEELTPSQREANLRAQTDYKSALQKIEDATTVRVPRSGSARKSMTVAASTAPMKSKSLYLFVFT